MIDQKTKIIVFLSNKGGTGKSTMVANISHVLATTFNKRVGIIDLDIHNPDMPSIFGVTDRKISLQAKKLIPVKIFPNLHIISYGFFLNDLRMPVIMRGRQKKQVVDQFINDTDWSDFDYIMVDMPTGISDEVTGFFDYVKHVHGVVFVTSSQDISMTGIVRSIEFALQYNMPSVGIIENMLTAKCTNCGAELEIYKRDSIEKISEEYKISIIAKFPFSRDLLVSTDIGVPFVEKFENAAEVETFKSIAEKIMGKTNQ